MADSQELAEEVECLANIIQCLSQAQKYIRDSAEAYFSVDDQQLLVDLKRQANEQFQSRYMQQSIEQTLECFSLANVLLGGDTNPSRIRHVVFENNGRLISLLLEFVRLPVPSQLLDKQNSDQLYSIKISALQCLTRFVSICSYEIYHGMVDGYKEEQARVLMRLCAESIVQNDGLDVMLGTLQQSSVQGSSASHDNFRLAMSELLFVFVTRNEMGKLAIVVQRSLNLLFKCLKMEKNALIRLHICAILREYCTDQEEEMLQLGILRCACKLLNIDPSPDVRAINAEIIETLFRSQRALHFVEKQYGRQQVAASILNSPSWQQRSPSSSLQASMDMWEEPVFTFEKDLTHGRDGAEDDVAHVPTPIRTGNADFFFELASVLSHRMQKDSNRDVLEACCKLCETLFQLRTERFMNHFVEIGGWGSFIRILRTSSVRPAALAVRALRYLVQNASSEHQLGYKIITHFPSLSVLLKAVLETTADDADDSSQQSSPTRSTSSSSTISSKRQQSNTRTPQKGMSAARRQALAFFSSQPSQHRFFDKYPASPTRSKSSPRSGKSKRDFRGSPKSDTASDISQLAQALPAFRTDQPMDQASIIAQKLLKVELSICIGLALSQNSKCRQHMQSELAAFPMWMASLRTALLNYLSIAENDYFADIALVDCTAVDMTYQVLYSINLAKGPAIKAMFKMQEKRIAMRDDANQAEDYVRQQHALLREQKSKKQSIEQTAVAKVKSFILSYAVHVTLQPGRVLPSEMDNLSTTAEVSRHQQYLESDADLEVRKITQQPSQREAASPRLRSVSRSSGFDTPPRRRSAWELAEDEYAGEDGVYLGDDDLEALQEHNQMLRDPGLEDEYADNNASVFGASHIYNIMRHQEKREQEILARRKPHVETMETQTISHLRRTRQPNTRLTKGLSLLTRFALYFIDENKERERQQSLRSLQREISYTQSPRRLQLLKDYYKLAMAGGNTPHESLVMKNYVSGASQGRAPPSMQAGFFNSMPGASVRVWKQEQAAQQNIVTATGTRFHKAPLGSSNVGSVSPQKIQKSWSQRDVREDEDLFEFEMSIDVDFRVQVLELLLKKAHSHLKKCKHRLLTCPPGVNGKGRRTFLQDMQQNILPRIIQLITDFIEVTKDRGEKDVRMAIYLWKNATHKSGEITMNHGNFVEVYEQIKAYFSGLVHNNEGKERRIPEFAPTDEAVEKQKELIEKAKEEGIELEEEDMPISLVSSIPENRHMDELEQALMTKHNKDQMVIANSIVQQMTMGNDLPSSDQVDQ